MARAAARHRRAAPRGQGRRPRTCLGTLMALAAFLGQTSQKFGRLRLVRKTGLSAELLAPQSSLDRAIGRRRLPRPLRIAGDRASAARRSPPRPSGATHVPTYPLQPSAAPRRQPQTAARTDLEPRTRTRSRRATANKRISRAGRRLALTALTPHLITNARASGRRR